MHNFFLHKNILIFRRFFNSANRSSIIKYIGTIKQRLSLIVVEDGLVQAWDAEKKQIVDLS